ncbi:MAG TPA: nucleotide exchange factor GrpE [Bacteroidia bacterium]|nr:nucleotide exchange factor GrpE [Bacteroidia bacterium]
MNSNKINTEKNDEENVQDENTPEIEPQEIPSHEDAEKNPVAGLEEDLAMTKDKLLRLYSEFDNYKKRTLREKIEFSRMASADTILSMLPMLDDFERAIKSMMETKQDAGMIEGVNLIYTKMKSTLEQKGLKEMKSTGEDFNADLHDALSNVEVEDKKMKGKVVEEIQKGYYLNGVVIRHAKVIVGN